ncbi:PilT/PilU family type 4a pilus ATPase [bacterium]|nr:PilT/PilU family type 4a pilus ATPase [bacterium]
MTDTPQPVTIIPYLKLAVEKDASDLFFTAKSPVMIKINGEIHPVGKTTMTSDVIRQLAYSMLDEGQQQEYEEELELDFATNAGGMGRFRVNLFHQRGRASMVMRYVKNDVPELDDLGLPDSLKDLIMNKRGMLLMVGATGSGKSTTLAAMINHRNKHSTGHILTIEDPIEFLHPNLNCIVNQREVGQDTKSYDRALHSSLRAAPDVILIGEIRARETMDSCVQLAGTGHLAISTLHANNAYQTLQRIINMYPDEMRAQLYMDLALNLRAVISQRLVKKKDGGRVAAVEVMVCTPYISELILKGQIDDIREAMAESSDAAMQTFDDSLYRLYQTGVIELEDALNNADSRTNLETRINFGG